MPAKKFYVPYNNINPAVYVPDIVCCNFTVPATCRIMFFHFPTRGLFFSLSKETMQPAVGLLFTYREFSFGLSLENFLLRCRGIFPRVINNISSCAGLYSLRCQKFFSNDGPNYPMPRGKIPFRHKYYGQNMQSEAFKSP